jgi:hypothetical protein
MSCVDFRRLIIGAPAIFRAAGGQESNPMTPGCQGRLGQEDGDGGEDLHETAKNEVVNPEESGIVIIETAKMGRHERGVQEGGPLPPLDHLRPHLRRINS